MPGPELELAAQAQNELIGKAQTIMGLINYRKATKLAKQLEKTRPKYKASPLADEDLSLAESDLAGGMSARAENAYKQQSDKQFSSSLEALLRGGGSVNNVADVFGNSQEGALRLAQMQDQLRLQQVNNVVRARRYKDEQLDKTFDFNEWRPWADKAQATAVARKEAQSAIWSGLQTSASATSNALSSAGQQQDFSSYFGGGGKNNSGSGFIQPSMGSGGDGLSYSSPAFNPADNQSYNWYQPDGGKSQQPRVPAEDRQPLTSFNDYNTDFLNDPTWWAQINGKR
jgi:hypothetical protein